MAKKTKMLEAALAGAGKKIVSHKLSTGSTLLNLSLTDDSSYGILTGHQYMLVGDSSSGKTWFCLSILAEATLCSDFNDYLLVYDNVENGALMNVEHFFGKDTARRMQDPSPSGCSETVEDFYYNITDLLDSGRRFIYILDSQDALTSKDSNTKFDEQKKAAKKGNKVAGSYGDGKPKIHSQNIRRVLAGLKKTGSILIMVSQTRDNLDGFGFETKTRSGGRAMKFYATTEIWTSIGKNHKKKLDGGVRISTGIDCIVNTKKNRITGRNNTVVLPIMNDIGIDDVGSMVDYLCGIGHWSGDRKIEATELDVSLSRSALVRYIENEQESEIVKRVCQTQWRRIIEESKSGRLPKYSR